LEEDKEKVTTFCMKGTETQKPPPLLLVLEAEEEGILRLASLSLTFNVTAWLPLLLSSLPWLALDTRKEKVRESRKSREIAQFWQRTPAEQLLCVSTKRSKKNGGEREREKWTFLR
jgi:hypothetical protein